MTVFIGDVHGKYGRYKKILKECSGSIQVGDMGVGFIDPYTDRMMANPPYDYMVAGNHRFIRGNHDSPIFCKEHSQWIPDGQVEDDTMFIGGATSIDKALRIEGYSWWREEELSYDELDRLVMKFKEVRPRRMVTHECPEYIAGYILSKTPMIGVTKFTDFPSQTRQAFQCMWELHKPEIWVFGHWHLSFDEVFDGTRFVCLNELEVKELA